MIGKALAYLCPLWQLPDYTNFPFRVQLCYYFLFFYWSLLQYIYILSLYRMSLTFFSFIYIVGILLSIYIDIVSVFIIIRKQKTFQL